MGEGNATSGVGSHLVVILDLSDKVDFFSDKNSPNFRETLSYFIIYCNTFLMLEFENVVTFYAVCGDYSAIVCHPKVLEECVDCDCLIRDQRPTRLSIVNQEIITGITELLERFGSDNNHGNVSSTIGSAICHLLKVRRVIGTSARSNILIVKSSADIASHYSKMMNCAFAAQKQGVVVDSICLREGSVQLQQISDITSGSYHVVHGMAQLYRVLMSRFFSLEGDDAVCRGVVSYHPACFCHGRPVNVGFVCSVCLSTYCQLVQKCTTCSCILRLPSIPTSGTKTQKN